MSIKPDPMGCPYFPPGRCTHCNCERAAKSDDKTLAEKLRENRAAIEKAPGSARILLAGRFRTD